MRKPSVTAPKPTPSTPEFWPDGRRPRPAPDPRTSPAQHDLKELQAARDALIKDRIATRNCQQKIRQSLLRRQNKARLSQIAKHLEAIDAQIQNLVDGEASLAHQAAILKSIPGVSSVTAAGLISKLPELGSLDAKSLTAWSASPLHPPIRRLEGP